MSPTAAPDQRSAQPTPRASGAPLGPTTDQTTPVRFTVLGTPRLLHHDGEQERDLTGLLTPKARDVLAFLALHRDGARRETIVTALWSGGDDRRLANRLYAALSQMRAALRTATRGAVSDLTTHHDSRYTLDPAMVTVDVWEVRDALRRHAADDAERLADLLRVAELYTGHLADDLTGDWATAPREALRRDVLDVLGGLVRTLGDDDPRKLDLLEQLRTLDPYNEAVYRDIARTQARTGRPDAVRRTLALLVAALADIDEQPEPDTVAFFHTLAAAAERRVRDGCQGVLSVG